MDVATIIGLVAGTLTTISFVPQLIKAWQTKSTTDISMAMYLIICTGIFLWLVYGILISSLPVILANGVTLTIALLILLLKLRYR
jgi:MtN3 and saliva related transmembrane protein